MIEQLTYIETDNTHPYKNLAVEEYLLPVSYTHLTLPTIA